MDCQLHLLHEDMKLYKAYEAVTELALADEEDLPPYLCTSCVNQLMDCARFRHRSLQAHLKLLDILKNHGHISVESIQDVIKTPHCDNKSAEEERKLSKINIEIKREDITEDPIPTVVCDNIKTEYIPNVGADDDLVDKAVVAPCMETNDIIIKEEVFDDTQVKHNLDDRELGTSRIATDLGENIKTECLSDDVGADNDSVDDEAGVGPCVEETNDIVKEEVVLEVSVDDDVDDGTLGTVFKTPSVNDVKCKNDRNQNDGVGLKKAAPKTSAERTRMYRLRKKQLALARKASAHEVVYTPSTSNSQMTFEPSPQPATAGKDVPLLEGLSSDQKDKLTMVNTREGMEITKELNHVDIIQQKGSKVDTKLLQNDKMSSDLSSNENDSETQLLSALQNQAKTTLHYCYMCNFKTESKRKILAHIALHSGYILHSVDIDGSSSGRNLLPSDLSKDFSCEICKKQYRSQDGLERHMLVHTDDKPYSCDICDKSYSIKGSLQYHLQTHVGAKPFTCKICDNSFTTKSSLKSHMIGHSDDKPHSCYICEKSFRHKRNLRNHMLVHSAVKQFSCDVCQRSFREKSSLHRHKLVHSTDRPYSCEVCKASFRQKISLQKHLLKH